MFNIFRSFLPVIVCGSYMLRTCVCDVWDGANQQTLDDIIPELYDKYRKALDGSDEATFTFRRASRNNKEYIIHINRLKAVNGLKKHNLIVKEKSDDNPLIYINNPVETKIPNAYLSLEGFKELLTGRVLRQREEFEHMYKTTSTSKSSSNKPNRVHYTKKKPKQTKPNKYIAPVTTNTKNMATNTIKTTKASNREITKTKAPFTTILVNNKLKHSGTTQLKASKPVAEPNTVLIDAIRITSRATATLVHWSTVEQSNTEQAKTEEPISEKSTKEEYITKMTTSHKSISGFSQIGQIKTSEKSTTKEIMTEKSITDEPTIEKITMEKSTMVKLNYNTTVKSETNTADKSNVEVTTEEPTVDFTTTETTVNVLRTVNTTEDTDSEKIINNAIFEAAAFNTTETSNISETTILDTSDTMDIENNTTAESKESTIVDLTTKGHTTEPTKESTTELFYPKRKTTTQEPSAEIFLPEWTKRPTTIRTTTTKATTKRRTLGRPLVFMGDMERGNQWG